MKIKLIILIISKFLLYSCCTAQIGNSRIIQEFVSVNDTTKEYRNALYFLSYLEKQDWEWTHSTNDDDEDTSGYEELYTDSGIYLVKYEEVEYPPLDTYNTKPSIKKIEVTLKTGRYISLRIPANNYCVFAPVGTIKTKVIARSKTKKENQKIWEYDKYSGFIRFPTKSEDLIFKVKSGEKHPVKFNMYIKTGKYNY